MSIAKTPEPPYYAVIFTSTARNLDESYQLMSDHMVKLAAQQPGYLGIESARNDIGITVSYWKDMDSIRNWKQQPQHQKAQELGKSKWYEHYTIRICKVEREYSL